MSTPADSNYSIITFERWKKCFDKKLKAMVPELVGASLLEEGEIDSGDETDGSLNNESDGLSKTPNNLIKTIASPPSQANHSNLSTSLVESINTAGVPVVTTAKSPIRLKDGRNKILQSMIAEFNTLLNAQLFPKRPDRWWKEEKEVDDILSDLTDGVVKNSKEKFKSSLTNIILETFMLYTQTRHRKALNFNSSRKQMCEIVDKLFSDRLKKIEDDFEHRWQNKRVDSIQELLDEDDSFEMTMIQSLGSGMDLYYSFLKQTKIAELQDKITQLRNYESKLKTLLEQATSLSDKEVEGFDRQAWEEIKLSDKSSPTSAFDVKIINVTKSVKASLLKTNQDRIETVNKLTRKAIPHAVTRYRDILEEKSTNVTTFEDLQALHQKLYDAVMKSFESKFPCTPSCESKKAALEQQIQTEVDLRWRSITAKANHLATEQKKAEEDGVREFRKKFLQLLSEELPETQLRVRTGLIADDCVKIFHETYPEADPSYSSSLRTRINECIASSELGSSFGVTVASDSGVSVMKDTEKDFFRNPETELEQRQLPNTMALSPSDCSLNLVKSTVTEATSLAGNHKVTEEFESTTKIEIRKSLSLPSQSEEPSDSHESQTRGCSKQSCVIPRTHSSRRRNTKTKPAKPATVTTKRHRTSTATSDNSETTRDPKIIRTFSNLESVTFSSNISRSLSPPEVKVTFLDSNPSSRSGLLPVLESFENLTKLEYSSGRLIQQKSAGPVVGSGWIMESSNPDLTITRTVVSSVSPAPDQIPIIPNSGVGIFFCQEHVYVKIKINGGSEILIEPAYITLIQPVEGLPFVKTSPNSIKKRLGFPEQQQRSINVYHTLTNPKYVQTLDKYNWEGKTTKLWAEEVLGIFFTKLIKKIKRSYQVDISSFSVAVGLPSFVSSGCKQRLKSAFQLVGIQDSVIVQATTGIGVSFLKSIEDMEAYILVLYIQRNVLDIALFKKNGSRLTTLAVEGSSVFRWNFTAERFQIAQNVTGMIDSAARLAEIFPGAIKWCSCVIDYASFKEPDGILLDFIKEIVESSLPEFTRRFFFLMPEELLDGLVQISESRTKSGRLAHCFVEKLPWDLKVTRLKDVEGGKMDLVSRNVEAGVFIHCIKVSQLGKPTEPSQIISWRADGTIVKELDISASKRLLANAPPDAKIQIELNEEGIVTAFPADRNPNMQWVPGGGHFMPLTKFEMASKRVQAITSNSEAYSLENVDRPPKKKQKITFAYE